MSTADTFNSNNFQDGWETPISVPVSAETTVETLETLATALENKLQEQGISASVSINDEPAFPSGFKSLDVQVLSIMIDPKNTADSAITPERIRASKNNLDLFHLQISEACKKIDAEIIETITFNSDEYGNKMFSCDNLPHHEN